MELQWRRERAPANGRDWTDHVTHDGAWRLEQGHSERSDDWAVLRRSGGAYLWVCDAPSLSLAKEAAEVIAVAMEGLWR